MPFINKMAALCHYILFYRNFFIKTKIRKRISEVYDGNIPLLRM